MTGFVPIDREESVEAMAGPQKNFLDSVSEKGPFRQRCTYTDAPDVGEGFRRQAVSRFTANTTS
jgi:hypothetical protein